MRFELSNREIGKRIKEVRISRGISRKALAAIVEISAWHLGLIECGRRGLTLRNCIVMCGVLNVSAEYIATGRGKAVKKSK
jgi:transcriptional regulator with XRE-family HTH domain